MNSVSNVSQTVLLLIATALCSCNPGVDERSLTEGALGVAVEEFPTGQGPAGFDEIPMDAPAAALTVNERPVSGPRPRDFYEERPSVLAKAPDGSVYEAYCGYADPSEIAPNDKLHSKAGRQFYGRHHGATYYPASVFIGRREGGLLNPVLIFPDVGSHTTAPHAFSVDAEGRCHLIVADVNIFQENRLELYWAVGDLRTGKWAKAWLLEKRGFTSWAQPRSVAWGDSVHLLWDWVDATRQEASAGSGLFHVEWTPRGFSRKVRLASGLIDAWDVAVDPESGRLLAVFSANDGVYGLTKSEGGSWSRPSRLVTVPNSSVSVESRTGVFLVRIGSETTSEWAVHFQEAYQVSQSHNV